MKTMQFIKDYLKDFARITIVGTNGDIWYEGDAISLRRSIVNDTIISKIDGLGSENDIIIEVTKA